MGKILVVYYSRGGYTRRTAAAIARECEADVDEIHLERHAHGGPGYLRCVFEALTGRIPDIRPAHRDPRQYGLVVIGTPIWCGNVSSPVRSYLQIHGGALRRVAFFATMGGSGAERAFGAMQALCSKPPVATLALRDEEIDKLPGTRLVEFAKALTHNAA
jgi:menaquinone-dependent protoporphyrinogen IX oxidase